MMNIEHIQKVMDEAECLFTGEQVEQAICNMAEDITEQLQYRNPLVLSVMNGGMVLTGHLLTKLNFPLEASYVHATRYRDEETGGHLDWLVKPKDELYNRTVLLVDDIHDEGVTLDSIVDYCLELGADDVYTAVLVNKNHDRKTNPENLCDFVGLEIEDRFIFGFGLDYHGYWRNANGIYVKKGY